jgi:hypothetical protein
MAMMLILSAGRTLLPRNTFWYSFLVEDESTPGPQCGQKDEVYRKQIQ